MIDPRALALIGLAVAAETGEQLFYRRAGHTPNLGHSRVAQFLFRVAPGVVCHIVRMAAFLAVLRFLPLGLAAPMLGLNHVTIALVARWLFKEPVDRRRWAGIALVTVGFAMVSAAGPQ